jgi:hypothetical protein
MSPIPVPKGRNLLRICHRPPVLEFRLESADAFCSCANQCTGHPSQIVVCAKERHRFASALSHFLLPFAARDRLASNRMKHIPRALLSLSAAALVTSAIAQPAVSPDLPVMNLDELGVYAVGYAYRGQAEQQFPLGWSGVFRGPHGGWRASHSARKMESEHFFCTAPGATALASPFSNLSSISLRGRHASCCGAPPRCARRT